jgi:hypothetical protein
MEANNALIFVRLFMQMMERALPNVPTVHQCRLGVFFGEM